MAKGTIKDITNDKALEAAGYKFVKKYPRLGQSNPYGSFKNDDDHEIQKQFDSKMKPDLQISYYVQDLKGQRLLFTVKDALKYASSMNESFLIESTLNHLTRISH